MFNYWKNEMSKTKANFNAEMARQNSPEYKAEQAAKIEKWESRGKKIQGLGVVLTLSLTVPIILTVMFGFVGMVIGGFVALFAVGSYLGKK